MINIAQLRFALDVTEMVLDKAKDAPERLAATAKMQRARAKIALYMLRDKWDALGTPRTP